MQIKVFYLLYISLVCFVFRVNFILLCILTLHFVYEKRTYYELCIQNCSVLIHLGTFDLNVHN